MSLRQIQKEVFSILGLSSSSRKASSSKGKSEFARGSRLYRDLVSFGNLETMSSIFPVCRKLLGEKRFSLTVEDYVRRNPPEHFRLNRIGQRFPDYLRRLSEVSVAFPFIAELADYEWLELMLMEDAREGFRTGDFPPRDSDQWECLAPVLNPVLEIRRYDYRIPDLAKEIDREGAPVSTGIRPTAVVVFREPESQRIRFLELAAVPLALLCQLRRHRCSYLELLERLECMFVEISADEFVANIAHLLKFFYMEGVLLGSESFEEVHLAT